MNPFYLHKHPCPECFGSISWLARKCVHCGYRITVSPQSAHFSVLIALTTFFALTGHSLLDLAGVL